jgi:hypothetical protein
VKPSELILNKYTVAGRRGFKSHPVRSLSTNDLSGERSKNVAKQATDEAKKACDVMDLIRGLAAEKTAWIRRPL